MRLYGGRLLKNRIRQMQDLRTETRDAILWDVDHENRVARVKIQGTNTLIFAHYPSNWEKTPAWLKPGNAVRICHTSGMRGRVELMGHGQVVPTPVPGSSPSPNIPTLGDAIISGCNLMPKPNTPGMYVLVGVGSFRIGGVNLVLNPIAMDSSTNFTLGDGGYMGKVAASLAIDPASATKFRYDSVVFGSDGICHVVKGSEFLTADETPAPPEAPSGHIRAGWILVTPGMTQITHESLNKFYSPPIPTRLSISIADRDLAWSELATTIEIGVLDQYGNFISRGAEGYFVTVSFVSGNGTLSYGGKSSTSSLSFYLTGTTAVVTYTRGHTAEDSSPHFSVVVELAHDLEGTDYITLRDESGNYMP